MNNYVMEFLTFHNNDLSAVLINVFIKDILVSILKISLVNLLFV